MCPAMIFPVTQPQHSPSPCHADSTPVSVGAGQEVHCRRCQLAHDFRHVGHVVHLVHAVLAGAVGEAERFAKQQFLTQQPVGDEKVRLLRAQIQRGEAAGLLNAKQVVEKGLLPEIIRRVGLVPEARGSALGGAQPSGGWSWAGPAPSPVPPVPPGPPRSDLLTAAVCCAAHAGSDHPARRSPAAPRLNIPPGPCLCAPWYSPLHEGPRTSSSTTPVSSSPTLLHRRK